MSLFSENRDRKVRGVVLKLVNSNCPELMPQFEDVRSDRRANLAVAVAVFPLDNDKIQSDKAFTAVTKDFSSSGVSIVTEQPPQFEQAIIGIHMNDEITFLLSEARHVAPMGGGLYAVGFQLMEVVSIGDYPALEGVEF
jgi:hypothetical protein